MAQQQFPNDYKVFRIDGGPKYGYVYKAATANKPTFLLLHGFPSSSYDWRKQIPDLVNTGYGILVPDLLGYGGTDKPKAIEEYAFAKLASHIAKILDHEGIKKAIGVGHDWGCGMLSRLANYQPEYLSALVFMAVPYTKPGPFNLDAFNAMAEQLFGYPIFGYWKFFNESTAAELCERYDESLTSLVYPNDYEIWKTNLCPIGAVEAWITANKTIARPSWLSEEEVDTHNKIMAAGGYTGPLNWYKAAITNVDAPNEANIPPENISILKKVLFVVGEQDSATRPEVAFQVAEQGRQDGSLPLVEVKQLEGCGHWMQLEKPEEVFRILDAFGKDVLGKE